MHRTWRSCFSAHTNLDNAVGGVNGALLAKLGYTAQWTPIPSELEVQDTKILTVH